MIIILRSKIMDKIKTLATPIRNSQKNDLDS